MRHLVLLVLLLGGFGHAPELLAQACTSFATGNWTTAGTWNAPCNVAGGPTAANSVTIQNGHTVTVTLAGGAVQAGALTIAPGNLATGVTLLNNLTVVAGAGLNTGDVLIDAPSTAVTKQINVGASTLAVGRDLTIKGGNTTASAANITSLNSTSGTINIARDLVITAGNIRSTAIATTATGLIAVTGNATLTGGLAANQAAQLTISGASAVGKGITIGGTLTLLAAAGGTTGSATVSMASTGKITVAGVGGVANGDTISIGTGTFTLTGANAPFVTGNTVATATSAITSTTVGAAPGSLTITGDATVSANLINPATIPSAATMSVTTGTISIGRDLFVAAGTAVANVNATATVSTGRINVTRNVTVTGGDSNTRDATLSATGAPTVGGIGINIGGTLTVAATVAGSSQVTLGAGSVITVAGNVTNGDTITVGAGTFNANGASFTTTNAAAASSTTVAANGTLNIAGNAFVTGGSTASSAAQITGTTGTIAITGNATVQGGSFNPSQATLSVTTTTGVLTVGGTLDIKAGSATNSTATVSVSTGRITVTGATLVQGGLLAGGGSAQLLASAGPVAPGTGINLGSTLDITTTAAVGVASGLASTNGGGTINVVGNVNNGGTVTIAQGNVNVTGAASTYSNSSAAVIANTTITSGTLNISGNTGALNNAAAETMSISTTGTITVGNTGTNTGTVTNSGTITLTAGGTFNANGNFTNSGTFTNTAAGLVFLRGATSTVNGTFNRGTGTVTMNGGAAQALSGTALTSAPAANGFANFAIDNTNGVSLSSTVAVKTALTFTVGNITTGANTLVSAPSCALGTTVVRTSGHVVGNFQKAIPAGASSCTFEIGTGANYTPAVLAFVAGTTAGNVTASTTGADHGSIGSSAINPLKSVNRFWTLTNGAAPLITVPVAGFTATFNFINGSPVDFDAAGDPARFFVQRFSGGWTTPTLNPTCTATPVTNLCEQVNGLTVAAGFGDFAIGEANYTAGQAGWFNIVETAGALVSNIFTKKGTVGFSLDVVAVNATRTAINTTYSTNPITVEVLNATDNSGALSAETDCRSSWTLVPSQSFSLSPVWTSGRAPIAIPAQAVLREARIRVTQGTLVGCSTDNFTIRPGDFAISSTNATNAGTSGTPTFKAGTDSFNLTATSVAGYTTTPSVDNTASMVVGTPTQGTIAPVTVGFGVAVAGVSTGNFTYSEVGNFGLAANAIHDDNFVVDTAPGDCTADFSTSLVGGKYGCKIGSAAVAVGSGFGRFIPDNFGVSYNGASFAAGCGTFSYVGTLLAFGTAPVITVTARNGSNVATKNYSSVTAGGAYMKLSNALGTSLNQAPYDTKAGRYTRFAQLGAGTPALDLSGLPATTADPAIGSFVNGVGTLTFSLGTGLGFVRSTTTPNAPFSADIGLALNVIDTDSVAFAGNPAVFGAATSTNGMTFVGGKGMRFGRLRMLNASGPATVALTVPIQTEYWTGSAFALNTLDSCTTLSYTNITLGSYAKNLNACETIVSTNPVTFSGGLGTLKLSAPGAANDGSLTLTPQLGSGFTGKYCTAVSATNVNEQNPTPANKSYLQGAWPGPSYDQNPTARGAFGTFSAQPRNFIFFRENY